MSTPAPEHPVSLFLLSERNPAERVLQLQSATGFRTIDLADDERALVAFTTAEAANAYATHHGLAGWILFPLHFLHELEAIGVPLQKSGVTRILIDPPLTRQPIPKELGAYLENLRQCLAAG